MKFFSFVAVLAIALPQTLFAQTAVRIGPDGVDVDAEGVSVQTDDDGVEVNTPDVDISASDDHLSIRIGNGSRAKVKSHKPIVCKDNDELTLTRIHIRTKGVGIVAMDNCELKIIDSHIDAKKIGIKISENAEVEVINSFVRGKKNAVHVSANGTVRFQDTEVRGKVAKLDNADVIKKGTTVVKR